MLILTTAHRGFVGGGVRRNWVQGGGERGEGGREGRRVAGGRGGRGRGAEGATGARQRCQLMLMLLAVPGSRCRNKKDEDNDAACGSHPDAHQGDFFQCKSICNARKDYDILISPHDKNTVSLRVRE